MLQRATEAKFSHVEESILGESVRLSIASLTVVRWQVCHTQVHKLLQDLELLLSELVSFAQFSLSLLDLKREALCGLGVALHPEG